MFEKKNKLIVDMVDEVHKNFAAMSKDHQEQTDNFNLLTEQNRQAMLMHKKVEKTFKDEGDAFFAERRKWKSEFVKTCEQ